MKTANIPLYGNIVLSVYKKQQHLRCLGCICSVSSPLRRHRYCVHALGPLNREDTDKCTQTIT